MRDTFNLKNYRYHKLYKVMFFIDPYHLKLKKKLTVFIFVGNKTIKNK